jgi:hypothetical protein
MDEGVGNAEFMDEAVGDGSPEAPPSRHRIEEYSWANARAQSSLS